MRLNVDDAFIALLTRLTPSTAELAAAYRHRSSVETALRNRLPVAKFRQIGSFDHGTGVRHHTDVDLLMSLRGERPSTDAALTMVKRALRQSFPRTTIRISRPAVVINFANGAETWEIVPAFLRSNDPAPLYDIPAPSGWLTSAPTAHLDYVTAINTAEGKQGGAKSLARLAKAWKYYNKVPISSFYLEMRAAQHMATRRSFSPASDLRRLLGRLVKDELASMNDPRQISSRFYPTSSPRHHRAALSKLNSAATRANKAREAARTGKTGEAFRCWDLVFGGKFPSC